MDELLQFYPIEVKRGEEACLLACASDLARPQKEEACFSLKVGDLPMIVMDGIIGIDAL